MIVHSYYAKKNAAKKEAKKFEALGIDAVVVPGGKQLGKRFRYFIVVNDKPAEKKPGKKKESETETFNEKLKRLNEKFFP